MSHSHSPRPPVKPGDWIFIGLRRGTDAVVCEVEPERVRVVYVCPRQMVMAEWVIWRGDRWAFQTTHPSSGYAHQNPSLKEFVAILLSEKPLLYHRATMTY